MGKNIITLTNQIEDYKKKLLAIQMIETTIAERVWAAATPLITQKEIDDRASAIADQLISDFPGVTPVLIGVANGGIPFLMIMVSKLQERGITVEWDTRSSSSYGAGQTSGELVLGQQGKAKLGGKTVFIVDDILDTGKTWEAIRQSTEEAGAEAVHMIAMLDKGQASMPADYIGFTLRDNPYVVGYGLDLLGGYLREKNEVRAVDPSTLPTQEELEQISHADQYNTALVSLIAERKEASKIMKTRVSVASSLGALLSDVSTSASNTGGATSTQIFPIESLSQAPAL